MGVPYRSQYKSADILYTTTNVSAGKWVEIGEKKVSAGIYEAIGFGFSNSQSDADGRVYAKLMDTTGTPVELVGTIRIMAYTPDDMPIGAPLAEIPTSKLNSSSSDLTKQLPFPILGNPTFLGQDYKFKFFFKLDASTGTNILSAANSVVAMDITRRSKSA